MTPTVEKIYSSWKEAGDLLGRKAVSYYLSGRLTKTEGSIVQYQTGTVDPQDRATALLHDTVFQVAREMGIRCFGCEQNPIEDRYLYHMVCSECRKSCQIWFENLQIGDEKDLRCERCCAWLFDTMKGWLYCRVCNWNPLDPQDLFEKTK